MEQAVKDIFWQMMLTAKWGILICVVGFWAREIVDAFFEENHEE